MKRRIAIAVVAVAVAILSVASCTPKQGPTGRVVDKDRHYVGKLWHYKLTTEDKAGKRHTFRVLRDDYKACYRGSSYPHCTEVR